MTGPDQPARPAALKSLLVANRGEVAVRVIRAARAAGLRPVAVFSEDDAGALHAERAAESHPLPGSGPRAYLSVPDVVDAATASGCDALHPGYGFLSESPELARACAAAGVVFVGPTPGTLELLGDKVASRELARTCGVPVLDATPGAVGVDEARSFVAALGGPAVIKAVAGGGGRGLRVVAGPAEVEEAWSRCRSEAEAAFGVPGVYVERRLYPARHLEVQVVGDSAGGLAVVGDRECSLQRRHQKLVEVGPAPGLTPAVRTALAEAALAMATAARCTSLVTFEFLADASDPSRFWFIEANPRLQVEHTVTEEVTGLDLVRAQLLIAAGADLGSLGITAGPAGAAARGASVQLRVNAEVMGADGTVRPAAGTVTRFDLPGGPGVRVDTAGRVGWRANPRMDTLLAKLVVHVPEPDTGAAVTQAALALSELRVDGVATNAAFLANLIGHPAVAAGAVHTGFVEENLEALLPEPAEAGEDEVGDPAVDGPGRVVAAPLQSTVVAVDVAVGDLVAGGAQLVVLEAMKMEHVVTAPVAGRVGAVLVAPGQALSEGAPLVLLEPAEVGGDGPDGAEVTWDPDRIRPDLAEVNDRHTLTRDGSRPDAVGRRRRTGQRTARENVADLCDPGSFVEYGSLVIAAQRRRRSVEDLIERTPADGLVAGTATVNAELFGADRSRCVVVAYDYTVLAGTQGLQNHRKKDRMFELAAEWRAPVVVFTEGGGGRPGDTDGSGVSGLDCMAFNLFGRLSGLVPLVGINSGRCFAGNAALLGCCDVVIATRGSNIGMGGPAMIEGGGLGVFRPEDVGPMSVQVPNGVVDVEVADEAEAVETARRYLSYFQGVVGSWDCGDQRRLRALVPENRLRVYDVRTVVDSLADSDSVLELRRHFGPGMVTALARVEGRPLGIIANNPLHLAGAIDADGADKAARFMQLCDAFGLPILFLCDTPGIMVGPDAERAALVRHCARLFVTGASLTVPFFTVVLRKGYGLGAQAMAGGSFKAPAFCVAWPTGEFGGMGLEGAVRLGYRRELDAVEDPDEREKLFDEMVARMYQHGKALNTATYFEIDDVIDPADTRPWITAALRMSGEPQVPLSGKRRPCVDTW
ncbi:MAG TPA: carboxyl transferase domain-containing protein [Acidimicrobiales bacterium]|nr:carboxyl transferase domain-containing protein [Acidimicrobiales bacterium]